MNTFNFTLGEKDHFDIRMEDEVVRGSIVLNNGELMWPPPVIPVSAQAAPVAAVVKVAPPPPNPFADTLKTSLMYSTGMS
jgi:H+-translocating NAD(P) transhydrogenase